MKKNIGTTLVVHLLSAICMINAYAQDWPQYLGPNRTVSLMKLVFCVPGRRLAQKFYGLLMLE